MDTCGAHDERYSKSIRSKVVVIGRPRAIGCRARRVSARAADDELKLDVCSYASTRKADIDGCFRASFVPISDIAPFRADWHSAYSNV
jgi:hypothetical protein